MTGAPKLKPDGKPMRALRVLEVAWGPLSERDVDRAAGGGQYFGVELLRLVRLGLAERFKSGGIYRYEITLAGREYLEDC